MYKGMSYRVSSINSAAFVRGSAAGKTKSKAYNSTGNVSKSTASKTNSKYVYKGNNGYIHQGGVNDIYIVQTEDHGSFEFGRKQLNESLQTLKKYHATPTKQLGNAQQLFTDINDCLTVLHGTSLYDLVLEDIRSVFGDVKPLKPGTLGAYFMGCLQDSGIPSLTLGCDPKCAGAVPPSSTASPGYNECEDMVLLYQNGTFSQLSDVESNTTYIYVDMEESKFPGFNEDNIKQLKDIGIQHAIIIYGGKDDGSYSKITDEIDVNNLPVIKNEKPVVVPNQNSVTPAQTNTNKTGVMIFFIIVAVLVILLFLFVLFKYMYPKYNLW